MSQLTKQLILFTKAFQLSMPICWTLFSVIHTNSALNVNEKIYIHKQKQKIVIIILFLTMSLL